MADQSNPARICPRPAARRMPAVPPPGAVAAESCLSQGAAPNTKFARPPPEEKSPEFAAYNHPRQGVCAAAACYAPPGRNLDSAQRKTGNRQQFLYRWDPALYSCFPAPAGGDMLICLPPRNRISHARRCAKKTVLRDSRQLCPGPTGRKHHNVPGCIAHLAIENPFPECQLFRAMLPHTAGRGSRFPVEGGRHGLLTHLTDQKHPKKANIRARFPRLGYCCNVLVGRFYWHLRWKAQNST